MPQGRWTRPQEVEGGSATTCVAPAGKLTQELRQVVLAVRTGSPLADALGEMAQRLQLPGLTRAVGQIIAALEHGAPLAGVLHEQAGDAREDAKRELIEQAGRREILMLLPRNIG